MILLFFKVPECDVPELVIPVSEIFSFFMISEPVSKKFGTEKSLGIGLIKLIPKTFRNPSRKIFVLKIVSELVQIFFFSEYCVVLGLGHIPIFALFYGIGSRNRSSKNLLPKMSRNQPQKIYATKKVSKIVLRSL